MHHAQRHANEFGRIKGADVDLAAGGKVIGAATVESLVRIRCKEDFAAAAGGRCQLGAAFDDFVQQQAVVSGDVFHIAHVLVAALDLERTHASVQQRFQILALVIVLHRQQVLVEGHHAAILVGQGIRQATGLRTIATVGAAAGIGMADETLAGEGHAQGTMNEIFDGGGIAHTGGNALDLGNGQLACQYQLRQAGIGQKARLVGIADIALGGGMQLDGRQVHLQDAHVLDDQRIHSGVVQLPDQLARGFQLGVMQDGVERGKNARMVAVGKLRQAGDVLEAVAGIVPGTKAGAADIHRIRAMQDGFTADFGSFGGGQQLDLVRQQTHDDS